MRFSEINGKPKVFYNEMTEEIVVIWGEISKDLGKIICKQWINEEPCQFSCPADYPWKSKYHVLLGDL